ncbi:DinB family protein [Deinococcus sp. Leaf326]|uniref:DinB family protein n=1 Tax=Deinococcus sp. Leaf326 TaxID=1736338 RepID=UPI0006F969E7|nr:DinB family protein [Deinococcus sp. Leaf326]KQR15712.1 hypothetical protein ASF71_08810 [Deinococcus sp. Leaf326]
MTLGDYLAGEYRSELELFRAALDSVPDEQFRAATLSHSPAWHALHIADWLRLMVLDDRAASDYHYLGWEDSERVQALGTQPAPLEDTAPKGEVLARLDAVGARVSAFLAHKTEAELGGEVFSAATPSGTRPRLSALGLQLRHVAYHRGQVQLGKKSG